MSPAEAAWRRNQFAVTAAAGLVFFGFTLVLPFLPYLVESLGARGAAVGLWSGALLSVAPLLAAILAPVWVRVARRTGLKLMVQRTMLAMAAHWFLMIFVGSLGGLLLLRCLLGVFSGFGTMSVALVTQGAPRSQVGPAVGRLQSVQIIAAASGPFAGGVLFDTIGLRATFAMTAALCLAAFVLVSAVYTDHPEESLPGGAARGPGFFETLRLPGIAPILFVLFWATVASRAFALVIPLYLKELDVSPAALGLVTGLAVSLGAFAEALSATIYGRLATRRSPRVLLCAGLTVAVFCVVAMAFVRDPWEFLALRVAAGLAAGGSLTLGYTMGSEIFPDAGRATSFSVLSTAAMMGGAVGPSLSGFVSWLSSVRVNFWLAAILYAGLALACALGVRRERTRRPPRIPYIPVPR